MAIRTLIIWRCQPGRVVIGVCGFSKLADFQQAHRQWVEIDLRDEFSVRDARWSGAVAVGSLAFVEKVKSELEFKAAHCEVIEVGGAYALFGRKAQPTSQI
jgi:hypothetical protein